MAELFAAGIRGSALELVSAWKEALLALGLVRVLREHGSLRCRPAPVDGLAFAYGAFVVVYGLIPQHWLGGRDAQGRPRRAPRPAPGRRLLLRPRPRS